MPEQPRTLAELAVRLPAHAAGAAVWVYQKTVSPALAAAFPTCGCRFHPTCSQYAREALHAHGLIAGTALTVRRLAKCGPWHPGGIDPVPESLHSGRPASRFTCAQVPRA